MSKRSEYVKALPYCFEARYLLSASRLCTPGSFEAELGRRSGTVPYEGDRMHQLSQVQNRGSLKITPDEDRFGCRFPSYLSPKKALELVKFEMHRILSVCLILLLASWHCTLFSPHPVRLQQRVAVGNQQLGMMLSSFTGINTYRFFCWRLGISLC